MRAADRYTEALFSTVRLEDFVPSDHPLRPVRAWVNEALAKTHVAQNTRRIGGSAIDGRTTRHAGYAISQRKRKCIEQCFGWGKPVGRPAR